MYPSHFTRCGRIVAGEDLVATTLCGAIREAIEMLHHKQAADELSGFEIWTRQTASHLTQRVVIKLEFVIFLLFLLALS